MKWKLQVFHKWSGFTSNITNAMSVRHGTSRPHQRCVSKTLSVGPLEEADILSSANSWGNKQPLPRACICQQLTAQVDAR